MVGQMRRIPEFIIFTGPMFGSKTTKLLAALDRFRYQSRKILAFKPKMDERYSQSEICTHGGGKIQAITVDKGADICNIVRNYPEPIDVVAVDEAFMIQNIDSVLISLYRKGVNIIVSSIQLDANEIPFENIKNMMPWATKIEICPAVCTMCDQDAYFTEAMFDINSATQEERIGSFGMYEPRCATHYTSFRETKD